MRYIFHLILFSPFFLAAQEQGTVSVFFDFDRFDLKPDTPLGVSRIIQYAEEGTYEVVSIKSFCDTTGSVTYNKALAQRRLNSIEQVLGSHGSKATKEVIGEEYPVESNYRSSEHRRVDITFLIHDEPEELVEEVKPEKSELVKSFEGFLKDSSSSETMIRLDVHFHPGMDVLLPESEPELWSLFDFLRYNEDVTAFIRGHVCCSDDMSLSIARAQVVYNFLVERSISPKRLSYKGFSNSMPAVSPEITEEDRIMNRRVDVVFTKTK
jgi:outer membrane protein OmpA-like peptidoglycan-associated protein